MLKTVNNHWNTIPPFIFTFGNFRQSSLILIFHKITITDCGSSLRSSRWNASDVEMSNQSRSDWNPPAECQMVRNTNLPFKEKTERGKKWCAHMTLTQCFVKIISSQSQQSRNMWISLNEQTLKLKREHEDFWPWRQKTEVKFFTWIFTAEECEDEKKKCKNKYAVFTVFTGGSIAHLN